MNLLLRVLYGNPRDVCSLSRWHRARQALARAAK